MKELKKDNIKMISGGIAPLIPPAVATVRIAQAVWQANKAAQAARAASFAAQAAAHAKRSAQVAGGAYGAMKGADALKNR